MSNDSSKHLVVKKRQPLDGWAAAILSLLGVAFVYSIVPVLASLPILAYVHSKDWSATEIEQWVTSSVPAQFTYIFIAGVLTIAAVWILLKLFGWSWRSIGLTKPRWYHPLLGLVAVVPYFLLYIMMAQVVSMLIPGFDMNQKQEIGFDSVEGGLYLALTFIALVIVAPITEEITMRGFLYTGLRKWLPRIFAALIVSVMFGAAHLAQGGDAGPLWIGALDTFILSIVLIALREKTGNLWAGITLHMTKNFVAFLALFVLKIS